MCHLGILSLCLEITVCWPWKFTVLGYLKRIKHRKSLVFSLKFSAQEFTGNFKRRWILLHLNVPEISHKILRCLCNCSENSCNKRKMRSSAYKYPANKGRRDYTVCYYKKKPKWWSSKYITRKPFSFIWSWYTENIIHAPHILL